MYAIRSYYVNKFKMASRNFIGNGIVRHYLDTVGLVLAGERVQRVCIADEEITREDFEFVRQIYRNLPKYPSD